MGSSSCKAPPVAAGFRNDRYNGLWYEVSKAQTAGGAYFEKDCVCTTIDIQPVTSATNGDSTAINSCRKLAPSGDFMNATGRCCKHVWATLLLYTKFSRNSERIRLKSILAKFSSDKRQTLINKEKKNNVST